MTTVDQIDEPLTVHMSVNLRRRNVCMTQHHLKCAQIRATA
jgi:hypothetical protein